MVVYYIKSSSGLVVVKRDSNNTIRCFPTFVIDSLKEDLRKGISLEEYPRKVSKLYLEYSFEDKIGAWILKRYLQYEILATSGENYPKRRLVDLIISEILNYVRRGKSFTLEELLKKLMEIDMIKKHYEGRIENLERYCRLILDTLVYAEVFDKFEDKYLLSKRFPTPLADPRLEFKNGKLRYKPSNIISPANQKEKHLRKEKLLYSSNSGGSNVNKVLSTICGLWTKIPLP